MSIIESSIKDCAKQTYLLYNQEEPEYSAGSTHGFEDAEKDGTTQEISFILQELEKHFGSEEGVIQQLISRGITPNAAAQFFHNYHYEI